ncbi:hypothetical protein [Rhizorhabdus histidinilytica]|uniref:hypothetical protein n=1 Tax=Rhizorhabdus histidinilytica TaxID=439228 RepID=UPI00321F6D3C
MFPFASGLLTPSAINARRIGTLSAGDNAVPSAALASIGARAGDFAIGLGSFYLAGSSAAGGWTRLGATAISSKILAAGDIGSGVTFGRGGNVAVYRGVNALSLAKATGTSGARTSMSTSGFSRGPSHAGLLLATVSVGANFTEVEPTLPTGFNSWGSRTFYNGAENPNVATQLLAYDRLQPNAPLYDGQGFSFGWDTAGGSYDAYIIELLRI